jgi:hypothetical protein
MVAHIPSTLQARQEDQLSSRPPWATQILKEKKKSFCGSVYLKSTDFLRSAPCKKCETLSKKQLKSKRIGGLPSKLEVLSSNPSITKRKQNKKETLARYGSLCL